MAWFKEIMSDHDEIVNCLARMRVAMLEEHPEWVSSCCSERQ